MPKKPMKKNPLVVTRNSRVSLEQPAPIVKSIARRAELMGISQGLLCDLIAEMVVNAIEETLGVAYSRLVKAGDLESWTYGGVVVPITVGDYQMDKLKEAGMAIKMAPARVFEFGAHDVLERLFTFEGMNRYSLPLAIQAHVNSAERRRVT